MSCLPTPLAERSLEARADGRLVEVRAVVRARLLHPRLFVVDQALLELDDRALDVAAEHVAEQANCVRTIDQRRAGFATHDRTLLDVRPRRVVVLDDGRAALGPRGVLLQSKTDRFCELGRTRGGGDAAARGGRRAGSA